MDKQKILNLVIDEVTNRFNTLMSSALEAKDAATNEESKAENKYDTRGLEASYLAGAQAKRSEKIKEDLFHLNKITKEQLEVSKNIKLLSIVSLEDEDGVKKKLFILPVQGGIKIKLKQTEVQTMTLSSPLGKVLLSKTVGDEVSLKQGKINKNYEILSIL